MHAGIQVGLSLAVLASIALTGPATAQEWKRPESRDRSTEFVGFLQPERLYWRPFTLPGVQPAEFKLLSFDESTGARTLLVRLPPGWKQASGYHSADLEMFIIEGGVSIDDVRTGRYSYAYYPAGYAHEFSTEAGALVLQWWSGRPDFVQSAESRKGAESAQAIEGWRFGDAPYIDPSRFPAFRDEPFPEGSPLRMKLLRHEESTGEMTWIMMVPGGGPVMSGERDLPLWSSSSGWQEGFLLAGDMTIAECLPAGQAAGMYSPLGYFFRPAGVRHGGLSHYSNSFAIWLFRTGNEHWLTYHESCPEPSGRSRGGRGR